MKKPAAFSGGYYGERRKTSACLSAYGGRPFAFLQRLWAFVAGPGEKTGSTLGTRWRICLGDCAFVVYFVPVERARGRQGLHPVAHGAGVLGHGTGLSVAFRESMEGGRAAIPVGETVWPGKIHKKAPQTEKIP